MRAMCTPVRETTNSKRGLSAKTVLAKWKTPAEELIGLAKLAGAFVDRELAEPRRICLVAPNRTWGTQLARACSKVGTRATLCMPATRMSEQARHVLATIDIIASPEDKRALTAWRENGGTAEEARELAATYEHADAFTLMHMTGIRNHPEFEHGLTQIIGDETPGEFARIIHEQLIRPTIADDCEEIPIVHWLRARGDFEYVLFASCVNGLVPGPQALAATPTEARDEELQHSERAFERVIGLARSRAIVSYFTRIEKDTAERARIPFARAKHEGPKLYAMVQPTPFLSSWGLDRPSTIGGQSLMRTYGLN